MQPLRGYRYFAEPDERDHRSQVIQQQAGPSENLSPLVQPLGESGEYMLRDCNRCPVRSQCRPDRFALEVCEMQIGRRRFAPASTDTVRGSRQQTRRDDILASIRLRSTFTLDNLRQDTALPYSTLRGYMSHLLREGIVHRIRRDGKHVVYELVDRSIN